MEIIFECITQDCLKTVSGPKVFVGLGIYYEFLDWNLSFFKQKTWIWGCVLQIGNCQKFWNAKAKILKRQIDEKGTLKK